jgi:hypothetical protein
MNIRGTGGRRLTFVGAHRNEQESAAIEQGRPTASGRGCLSPTSHFGPIETSCGQHQRGQYREQK